MSAIPRVTTPAVTVTAAGVGPASARIDADRSNMIMELHHRDCLGRIAALAAGGVDVKLHGRTKNAVVLDPFVGIGSSAVAARSCGVGKFIGFDIDAHYLAVATERTGTSVQPFTKLATSL